MCALVGLPCCVDAGEVDSGRFCCEWYITLLKKS